MKEYFNINGTNYLFRDIGAVYFDVFGSVTMIYNKNIISNILKTKRKILTINIKDDSVTSTSTSTITYTVYCCGSGVELNELACAFLDRQDLTGEVLIVQEKERQS